MDPLKVKDRILENISLSVKKVSCDLLSLVGPTCHLKVSGCTHCQLGLLLKELLPSRTDGTSHAGPRPSNSSLLVLLTSLLFTLVSQCN